MALINDCDGLAQLFYVLTVNLGEATQKNQILLFHGSEREESDLILCQSFILSDSSFFAVSSDDGIINHLRMRYVGILSTLLIGCVLRSCVAS